MTVEPPATPGTAAADRTTAVDPRQVRHLLADIRRRLGNRVWLLLTLMVLNAYSEALTITMLFPLLHLVGVGDAEGGGMIGRAVEGVFGALGLPVTLPAVLGVVLVLVVVQTAFLLLMGRMGAQMYVSYLESQRVELLRAFLAARWRFFVQREQGHLYHALLTETERTAGAFQVILTGMTAAVVGVVYLSVAFFASWQITAALLVGGGVVFLLTRPIVRDGARVGRELSERCAVCYAMVNEFLGNAKLIKATATEGAVLDRFTAVYAPIGRAYFQMLFQPHLLRGLIEAASILLFCALLAIGFALFAIDAAIILLVLALFVRLYPKLSALQQSLHLLNLQLPAIARVRRFREAAESLAEPTGNDEHALPLGDGPVAIGIEHLTAGYEGHRVLNGVDMDLPAGGIVAIVGPSGAGKSTLIDCLLQLVDAERGRVLVNGQPLSALGLRAWRRRVGYVGQETLLLNASIRDNLRWGAPALDETALVEAARQAGAHDFVTALPSGYDTVVGDRGGRLSGGQRQRLGLARALAGAPVLLILDEATSALDAETEAQVMDSIIALRGRVTTVLVTHRLSTARVADWIYVLEEGRVVESGTWDDLTAADGTFSRSWALQGSRS